MQFIMMLSIIFMIAEHTYKAVFHYLTLSGSVPYTLSLLINFTASIAASPVLVFIAGFMVAVRPHVSSRELIEKAFYCCGLGIFVNTIRAFLPAIYEAPLKLALINRIPALFEINLCFYLAVFLLFFALIHHSCHKEWYCIIAVLLSIVLITIIPDAGTIALPLIPVSIIGYLYGMLKSRALDQEAFCVKNTLISINIVAVLTFFIYASSCTHVVAMTFWLMAFVYFWVSGLCLLFDHIIKKPIHLAKFTYTHVLTLYVSHWIILACMYPYYESVHNTFMYIFFITIASILTYALTYVLYRMRDYLIHHKEENATIKSV